MSETSNRCKNYLTYREDRIFLEQLNKKDFWNLLYSFGIDCLLDLLDELEEKEEFEDCASIKKVIEEHNSYANHDLPTKKHYQ